MYPATALLQRAAAAALGKAVADATATADALQTMYNYGAGISVELGNAIENVQYTSARLREAEIVHGRICTAFAADLQCMIKNEA